MRTVLPPAVNHVCRARRALNLLLSRWITTSSLGNPFSRTGIRLVTAHLVPLLILPSEDPPVLDITAAVDMTKSDPRYFAELRFSYKSKLHLCQMNPYARE